MVRKILNIEALMDSATTGRSVMTTLLRTTTKLTGSSVYSDQKKYKEAVKELKAYVKARPDAKDVEAVKTMVVELEAKVQP